MATATLMPPPLTPQRLKKFTVAEYERLHASGFLSPEDRCELIRGFLVEKPPMNPPHATALSQLHMRLLGLLGLTACVRAQMPVRLADSMPLPDLVWADGAFPDYAATHPTPKQVRLLVEVSESTLAEDRGTKLELYAENKIAEYWIVNLIDGLVEVYTQPRGGKKPTYRARTDYTAGQCVPVVLGGKQMGTIPVSEIIP